MIKFDIIITWPKSCDYPLWRQFIRDNRDRFNEIIIAFHETNQGDDYRDFIRRAMFEDYCHFVYSVNNISGIDDWRNVLVNTALIHSYNAEWVWFTEQDFIVTSDIYWTNLEKASNDNEILAVYQGPRMHPCSIHVKRSLLNKTSRNFSVVPNISDHFSIFQKEIEALQCPIYHIQ